MLLCIISKSAHFSCAGFLSCANLSLIILVHSRYTFFDCFTVDFFFFLAESMLDELFDLRRFDGGFLVVLIFCLAFFAVVLDFSDAPSNFRLLPAV